MQANRAKFVKPTRHKYLLQSRIRCARCDVTFSGNAQKPLKTYFPQLVECVLNDRTGQVVVSGLMGNRTPTTCQIKISPTLSVEQAFSMVVDLA